MTTVNEGKPGVNKGKQGISLDEKAQEQPIDKERAQAAHQTENAPKKEQEREK